MSTRIPIERAVAEIRQALSDAPEHRIVHCEADEEWYPELLRNVSAHRLTVLAPAADIIVYFDAQGREIGWRDDGRRGAPQPALLDRDVFLSIVRSELDLPPTAWLGKLAPEELPPLGWTQAGVIFLKPAPGPEDVLRVWLDPASLTVIQCLAGPPEEEPSS